MARYSTNTHAWPDQGTGLYSAPLGTALPSQSAAWTPGSPPAGFFDHGLISDKGITRTPGVTSTLARSMQGDAIVRNIKSAPTQQWTLELIEYRAENDQVFSPANTVTTTGGTAEIQTVTATATAGTFTVTANGQTTSNLTYNITTTALQTALQALGGYMASVTVGGTVGAWTVTWPAQAGNVPTLSVNGASLTPANSISVATTTPGANGINFRYLEPFLSVNSRIWIIDSVDGTNYMREVLTNAELMLTGAEVRTPTALSVFPVTITPYPDPNLASGRTPWGYRMDNMWSLSAGQITNFG